MKLIHPFCIVFAAFVVRHADAVAASKRGSFGLIGEANHPMRQTNAATATLTSAKLSIVSRGGACDDTNAALLGKVGLGALLQAAGLMGVLAMGKAGVPLLSKVGIPVDRKSVV